MNFENPALFNIKFNEFRTLLEIYWEIFPDVKKIFIFIDEPQEIENWAIGIKGLYDEFKFPIFITGSSSKLLGSELATELRGISRRINFYSLSFKEFLAFKDFGELIHLNSNKMGYLQNLLNEYMKYGGYPEVVLEKNNLEKNRLLSEYLQMVIYRDLIDRYKLQSRNQFVIELFTKILVKEISKEISINKLQKHLKNTQKINVSNKTLYNYMKYLEDACIIFQLRKFEPSLKRELLSNPKVYVHDLGLCTLFSQHDKGYRLENAVFMELMRRNYYHPLRKINYWKSDKNKEVDFVIREGENYEIIQVSYDISSLATREREISSLLAGLKQFNLEEGTIITKNEEEIEIIGAKKIIIIPFWKWALNC